jgi:hypothetical protein
MSSPRPVIEVKDISISGGINIFVQFHTLHDLLEYSKGFEGGDIIKCKESYYLLVNDVAYYYKEEK